MVVGDQDHEQEDDDGDKRKAAVIKDFARGLGFALLPVAEFGPVFHANLFRMGEIPGKFVSFGVPISGIALHGAVQNLLQLRRNRWVGDAWGNGVVEEPFIHGREWRWAGKGEFAGEHFVEDYADGVDVRPAIAALSFDLLGRY